MKWNTEGKKWQQSKRGTARAREFYFVTKHGTGSAEWVVGYRGFGQLVEMKSAGTFKTAREARAYCEELDANAVIIEEVSVNA
jgi:hypothetical protein